MALYTFISNSKSQPKNLINLLPNISFLFLLFIFLKFYIYPSNFNFHASNTNIFNHARILTSDIKVDSCTELHNFSNYTSKCIYVKTHSDCRSKGYINYLQIFYCNLGNSPILGHTLLVLWLVILFYLLADTASNYFCTSLEGLSNILRLSPTIAGVTLLSLGNGAPDFFASVVSFTSSNNGAVGLNSILGGAFFVSTAVLGIISILVSSNEVAVDKASFIRDAIFFLCSLFILLIIISIGKISLFGSICYMSIYFLYVCVVSATHFIYEVDRKEVESSISSSDDFLESGIPLLGYVDDDDETEKPILQNQFGTIQEKEKKQEIFIFSSENSFDFKNYLWKTLQVLELPLSLPRKLTIPIVSEENWSKPYAIISCTLAPILFAILLNTQMENMDSKSSLVAYLTSSLIGIVLGNMACVTTKSTTPPRKCLFPWLVGGFSMSVTWTYIIAEELVSLLVSIGYIIGISPSILGLTVLAWGNSLGDLIANGAMAKNGGNDGTQIAFSGCFAGPMFNMLMGLGLPLVLSSWSEYPKSYVVPKDGSLLGTILFLMTGIVWALIVLIKKNMRLHKSLGFGLLTIYICFLCLRLVMATGVIKL